MPLTNGLINIDTVDFFNQNCVIWVPSTYDASKKYPLIIAGEGSGEAGIDINLLYNNGLPAALKAGFVPPFDCIILCPQRSSFGVDPAWLPGILQDAKKRWSIDTTKIFLTGYSAGGWMCWGAVMNISAIFGQNFAGMVVLSGETQDANMANISWWKTSPVPVLCISGDQDAAFTGMDQAMTAAINAQVTNLATMVLNKGVGHGGWIQIYNATNTSVPNIWTWMQNIMGNVVVSVPPPPPVKTVVFTINLSDGKHFTLYGDGSYALQ